MFENVLLLKIKEILSRSHWMRFNLDYSRGMWSAAFTHEKGKIYGRATHTFPANAVNTAYQEAELKTRHLLT